MPSRENLEAVENKMLKKWQKRDQRKSPKMKVSGKQVFKLKK